MIQPFRHFIQRLHRLFDDTALSSTQRQQQSAALLKNLIQHKDWLPEPHAQPHPERYRQQLLYADLDERFSVLSFVWGPGQATPIHDHGVWGLVGVLHGAEVEERYKADANGQLQRVASETLHENDVSTICPRQGDIHQVRNAYDDRVSISIHMYAGNIGRIQRHSYDATSGEARPFISRYENALVPNLWFEPNA